MAVSSRVSVPWVTTTPETSGSARTSATVSTIRSHSAGPKVEESASRTARALTRISPGSTARSASSIAAVAGSESPATTAPSGVVEAVIVPPVVQITMWGVSVLVWPLVTRSTVLCGRLVVKQPGRRRWNNDRPVFVGPVTRPGA